MTNQAAIKDSTKKSVLICDTQPVAVEGMKWLIESSGDLWFAGSVPTLDAVHGRLHPDSHPEKLHPETTAADEAQAGLTVEGTDSSVPESAAGSAIDESAVETVTSAQPLGTSPAFEAPAAIDAVVIDKGFGLAAVMDLLQRLTSTSHPASVIVWGSAISESEALRLLQAGARGILRRSSESGTLLTCLRAVTSGSTWMEDGIFGSTEKLFNPKRSQLTHRENEVVVLVEKGLRNRDIARILGIQTGTVKIHLKHIFEKTGVRGRYGLAFTGLQNKGSITMSAPTQFNA